MSTEAELKRPNSYQARVLPYIRSNTPRWIIESETGIKGTRLTHAIKKDRSLGLAPKLLPEEQTYAHRLNTSYGRGGILIYVAEFFPLDLTSRQTQVALQLRGVALSQSQISHVYAREVHRHHLQRPQTELTAEAQRDKGRSPDDLIEIVTRRQQAYDLVQEYSWNKPNSLTAWHLLEGELDQEDQALLRNALGDPRLLPKDILAQRFLLDLFHARQLWYKEQDMTLLSSFSSHFREIDPSISERLKSARAAVVKRTTPPEKPNKQSISLAT